MALDPFPTDALPANRAGRLTPEQVAALRLDAKASTRSGLLAGLALLAFGLFLVWGAVTGRVHSQRVQTFAVGAGFAIVGGLFLRAGGKTRGPRAAEAASESTVLDVVEGPFRRERYDRRTLGGSPRATRGSARYLYLLHVGARQLSVSESAYEVAPDDGIVRVFLLPNSDRVVNLERIADAPPGAAEARAAGFLRERFGAVPGNERPSPPGEDARPG